MKTLSLSLSLVFGIMLTTPALANEFCGRQYQICLENFGSEPNCAEGQRRCEEARKDKNESKTDGSKKDKSPKKDKSSDKDESKRQKDAFKDKN